MERMQRFLRIVYKHQTDYLLAKMWKKKVQSKYNVNKLPQPIGWRTIAQSVSIL